MESIQNVLTGLNQDISMVFNNKFVLAILVIFLIIATYTDIKKMKIYDVFNCVFLAIRISIIFIPVYGLKLEATHLIGGVVGFIFLLAPAIALMHKMGGDIKFMAVLGLYLGWHLTILFLFIACVYNLLYALTSVFILKKSKLNVLIPFAPFFLLSFITIYGLSFM